MKRNSATYHTASTVPFSIALLRSFICMRLTDGCGMVGSDGTAGVEGNGGGLRHTPASMKSIASFGVPKRLKRAPEVGKQ